MSATILAFPPRPAEVQIGAVDAVWIKTIRALVARREGRPEPCAFDPADVVAVLDRLYRQRKITLAHARILRIWGERGDVPNPAAPAERSDAMLWSETMALMRVPLMCKGIVR